MMNPKLWQHFAALLALPVAATSLPLLAQDTAELPECESIVQDPDGDGFGWVVSSQSSCRVTENTTPAPEHINMETGQPVLLERAYWDGNADLVNRNLHCRQFEWNEDNSQYQPAEEHWFRFLALPQQPPWIADYYALPDPADLETITTRVPQQWSVDFGLFTERDFHFFPREEFPAVIPWIERFTTSDGQQGVRFWVNIPDWRPPSDVEYSECLDTSGAPFGPTGHWDYAATNLAPAYSDDPLYFIGAEEPYPEITNRETGQPVQLESGYWEFHTDLSHREVQCAHIAWDEDRGDYHQARFNPGFTDIVTYHPPLADSTTNESWAWLLFDGQRFPEKWQVDGAQFTAPGRFANSMWYEPIVDEKGTRDGTILVQGVRYWGTPADSPEVRNTYYIDCYALERPSRGLWSGTGWIEAFKPSFDAPPENVEPPATDIDADAEDGESEQTDNTDADGSTTDSETTPDLQGTDVMSGGGGGGFSWLIVLFAVFGNRVRRI